MMKLQKLNKTDRFFYLALAVILLLTLWSVITFKQRMLFTDPAWIVFNIINHHSFAFAEHRFGAFITQIFPLAGVCLGLPLKAILILYSASFYLFYLSAALVLGFLFRQKWLAILLAFYLLLFVSDGFYWPNNEVHQGITWMLLFIGVNQFFVQKNKKIVLGYTLSFVFLVLAISCHLLVALPLLFLWFYIHKNAPLQKLIHDGRFVLTSLLIVGLLLGKYQLSHYGWYDGVKLQGIEHLSFAKLVGVFHSGSFRSFSHLLFENYWLAIIVFAGSCCFMLKSRQYLGLIVMCFFTLSYIVLVCLTFPGAYGRSMQFYMEGEWAALSIIIATPMLIGLMSLKSHKMPMLILLSLFGIRMIYIFSSFNYFDKRLNYLSKVVTRMQQQNIHKALFVADVKSVEKMFIMDWGLPVESLMLSQMEGYKIQTTFKVIPNSPPYLLHAKDSFYAPFDIKATKDINAAYFCLDTAERYQIYSDKAMGLF